MPQSNERRRFLYANDTEYRERKKTAKKKYYLTNKTKLNSKSRLYYTENREAILKQKLSYNKLNKSKRDVYEKDRTVRYAEEHGFPVGWKWSIKHYYNLTPEQYVELYEKQSGLCAICGQPETSKSRIGKVKLLSVDHNHKTNQVRGLLCNRHNRALGSFDDDEELLMNAIKYLKESQNNEF